MHKLEHAGESAGDKLARMRAEMAGEWVLHMLRYCVLVHREVLGAAMQARLAWQIFNCPHRPGLCSVQRSAACAQAQRHKV